MPRVDGLRSPYDKTVGDLHHLGRMLDKIRLRQAGKLPGHYHRNYELSIGLRPNRLQTLGWNEHSRKIGWNDRISAYLASVRTEPEWANFTAVTSFDLIEQSEEREPPPLKG